LRVALVIVLAAVLAIVLVALRASSRSIAARYIIGAAAMDETPEELEQIRREAERIDVNQYRKRFRVLKAVALGAFMAGIVWVVLWMIDSRKNPCERLRDHFCGKEPRGAACASYQGIWDESIHDESPEMRANIRAQCQSKIERLKEEDGVSVR
jgi:hypothetical protein